MYIPNEIMYHISSYCDYVDIKNLYHVFRIKETKLMKNLLYNKLKDKIIKDTTDSTIFYYNTLKEKEPIKGTNLYSKKVLLHNEKYTFTTEDIPNNGISSLRITKNYNNIIKLNLWAGGHIIDSYIPEYFITPLEFPFYFINNKNVLPFILYQDIILEVISTDTIEISFDVCKIKNPSMEYIYKIRCHNYESLNCLLPTDYIQVKFDNNNNSLLKFIIDYNYYNFYTKVLSLFFPKKQELSLSLIKKDDVQVLELAKPVCCETVKLISDNSPKLIYTRYYNIIDISCGMINALHTY